MNEEEYVAVCEACNEVLVATDSNVERVAIPWLHVIREHPVILRNYSDLTGATPSMRARRRRLTLWARNVAGWLWQFRLAMRVGGELRMDGLPTQVDVLFVSHLVNASQAGQADDFYYSALPSELAGDGLSAVIALIDSTGRPGARVGTNWAAGTVPRVILDESLSLGGEWSLYKRLRRESRRLAERAGRPSSAVGRRVCSRAAQEALSSGARRTLRMEGQIAGLVARLKPRALVVTHEGHAWERVAFAAARRAHPGILCVGYQHGPMFRLQHAIRQKLAPQYTPDRIMTSGAIGKSQLENEPALKGVRIEVLGSNRAPRPHEGHVEHAPIDPSRSATRQLGCLVIPEGLAIECDFLFEFSLACARLCPDVQFVWRLHPSVTFGALLGRNAKLRNVPNNIRRSEARLEEDLALCRLALYRGTTAIVRAVGAGLRPVYLKRPGEMTIDPLYAMPAWRVDVETPREFQKLVRVEAAAPDPEAMRTAMTFCAQVFQPFNRRVLVDALARPGGSCAAQR